jgi:hypothetical protein
MDDARRKPDETAQPRVNYPRLPPQDRGLPEGRLRQELARKKHCCENCVYATRPCGKWLRLLLSQFAGLWLCANSAEAPGELRGVPGCSTCPNFRPKRLPTVQAPPPPPPEDKAFYYIPLTQGKHAMVDAEDYDRVKRHKWCLSRVGNRLYAYRKHHGKTQRMHQFIMNPPKGKVVDHHDGNGLNNRRCNLRICTPQQNACNHRRRKEPGASSPYIGVYRYKGQPDKWYVKVQCRGDVTNLGPFDSAIEAARARDRLAVELFGEYASLNLPEEWPPERRAAVMAEARSRALVPVVAGVQSIEGSGSDTDSHG